MRTDSPDNTVLREASPARKRFALVAVFAGLWLVGLGVLSYLTANPITLNREQVVSATDVLTAVVEDANTGTIRVEKSWKERIFEASLTLPNLSTARPVVGERYLIPVSRTRGGWQVARSKLPDEPPLIYPATPESETQLRQLLKADRQP